MERKECIIPQTVPHNPIKGAVEPTVAKKVKPFFPNQDGRGTHMNISGAGLIKGAPNKANAIKLVEFLLSEEAQNHIVNNTFEYPMIDGVEPHKLVAQMGLGFKQDLKNLSKKSDFKGFQHIILYFLLLFFFGIVHY